MTQEFDLKFRNLRMEILEYHSDDSGKDTENIRVVGFYKDNQKDIDCALSFDEEGNIKNYGSPRRIDDIFVIDKYSFDKSGKLISRAFHNPFSQNQEEIFVHKIDKKSDLTKMIEQLVFALGCEAKDRLFPQMG